MKRQHKQIVKIIFALGLTASNLAPAGQETEAPSNLEELKAEIAQLIIEKEVPAVSIAMVDENGPVWIGALGLADIDNNVQADKDTLFRIGSTSKMFVALSVLKLVDEGKLSLDDKLSELAPEIAYENQWEDTDPIRIVHLLEHTTGWDDFHLPEYAHNDPTPATLKQGLDYHPHSRVSRWQPGSRMSYCNSGPPVAAHIVEKISGQVFEDYVRENFFEPMAMESVSYFQSAAFIAKGATLYANGNKPQEYWHLVMRPSGSINASASDMARFVAFYLNRGAVDGQQLVSKNSLMRMETVKSTSAAKLGQQTGFGLNNYSSPHKSWVYREHGGGVIGGITEFAYLPEAQLGHAIMINSDDYSTFREISKLVRDYETRHLPAKDVNREVVVTAEHRSIEGLYYPINSRMKRNYFLDRILRVQKLWFDGDELHRRGLFGGEVQSYYPISADFYKSVKTGVVSLSNVVDPLAGPVVHADATVLKPVATWLMYVQLGIVVLWGLSIASSILYFMVWIVRKLRGKIIKGATVRIRLWPLLASVSVIVGSLPMTIGIADPFKLLGSPTYISVGIMLATVAFASFAVLGVYTSVQERRTAMNRGNYWYSTASSFVHLLVTVYLLSFGVIGLMTWA